MCLQEQINRKYNEFEPTIILIDIALLSENTYRYVMSNATLRLYGKLALALLLLESFASWRQKTRPPHAYTRSVPEKLFYFSCLESVTENMILVVFLIAIYTLLESVVKRKAYGDPVAALNVCKAAIIANLGKFLLLPMIVWRENTADLERKIHCILIAVYYLVSFVQVFSVVSRFSKVQATVLISLSLGATHVAMKHFTNYLGTLH